MRARVLVTLKKDVLDPQGKAIQRAARNLGFEGIEAVRQGKLFEITLEAADWKQALAQLEDVSRKLLANPVIEDFRIETLEP